MNNPLIWNWLRLLATLYVLCLLTAGIDLSAHLLTQGMMNAPISSSIGAMLHLSTLWWVVTFCFSFLLLPLVALFWRRAGTSQDKSEEHDKEDAVNASREDEEGAHQWDMATRPLIKLLLGRQARHHWGVLVALAIAIVFGLLTKPFFDDFVAATLKLSYQLAGALVLFCAWLLGYAVYRILTKLFDKSATFPAIIAFMTAASLSGVTEILASLDVAYAAYSPLMMSVALVILALALSARLPLKGAKIIALAALVLAALSIATYEIKSTSHRVLMHQSLWGELLPPYTIVFFDPDADDSPSRLPVADCGPMDEFQHFEAIEVIGDGKDNNCLGGDISEDEISPMSPAESQLAPISRKQGVTSALPPIIFLSVDTLRADYIGKKINGRSLTPTLDAFLAESTHFTHAYAPSTHTMGSMPSTFSGMYPGYTLLNGVFLGNDRTFPEMARELGYTTEGVITLPKMHHSITTGFQRIDNTLGFKDASTLTGATLSKLASERLALLAESTRPFLLWVHHFDPHGFYVYNMTMTPWLDDMEDHILRGYAQEVWRTDAHINTLFKDLKRRGLYDKAIIVFFSDHGEGLGEDGVFDHAFEVAENIIRVPFAIKLPGVAPRKINTPVSLLDLVPTLVDYMEIEGSEPRPGRSLLAAAKGEPLEMVPIYVSATYQFRPLHWTLIEYPWKLIFDRQRLTFRLQNIEDDPNALGDVSAKHPEVFERMYKGLARWRDANFHDRFIQQKAHRLKARQGKLPEDFTGSITPPVQVP